MSPHQLNNMNRMRIRIPKSWILLAVFIVSVMGVGAWIFTTPPNGLTNQTGSFFGNTSNDANNYTADNFITNPNGSLVSGIIKGNSNGTKAITVSGGNGINLSGSGYPGGDGSGMQGALILRGSNQTDADAQIAFQPLNRSGYGIIKWMTNTTGRPTQWDVILQAHHLNYQDDSLHDHLSLYTLAQDFTSVKIFNIPYNISVINYSWDIEVPMIISNSENKTMTPYIKLRDLNSSLYTKQINTTVNAGQITIYGQNYSGATLHNLDINTNTSLTTDNASIGFSNNRGAIGYDGDRSATFIRAGGETSGKNIVFDTSTTERMRIQFNGAATQIKTNLTLNPTLKPSCITMYSPDGTAYRFTIANGGTTNVAAGVCDT